MAKPAGPHSPTPLIRCCPFCGHDWVVPCEAKGAFWIRCQRCRSDGPSAKNEVLALAAWNKRHHEFKPAKFDYLDEEDD
jgi:transcription elongation factor Elf1